MTGNRYLRRGLVVTAGLLLVLVAGAVRDAWRIRSDLDDGRRTLEQLDLDVLRRDGLGPTIQRAADDIEAADDRARTSLFLRTAGVLPFVGGQVDGLRDLTAAIDVLGTEARTTGDRIEAALDRAGDLPAARVDLLTVVLDELERIEVIAAGIDVGATGTLVGPLDDARASLVESLDSVPERFQTLEERVAALRDLFVGPTLYLVNVGNNAEMRAGAGMPLSVGRAAFVDGEIGLGEFKAATSELYTPAPTGAYNTNIAPALRETYPRWNIGQDFAETAVVPDFDITAPIYADIAKDTQDWDVQGAVHIDAVALSMLLEVVGPIDIGGTLFTAATAPQLVLNETYLAYDGVSRWVRRDMQSDLAKLLFEAIESRDVDLLDLVGVLQQAAEGRHLMAWSRDPVLQDLFESFGASGEISPFATLVSLQNTSANKLDWYIDPSVEVDAEPVSADEWLVTLTTSVRHPERELTVAYIEGPFPELAGGIHRALLTVQVPQFATHLDMPDEEITELGDDGSSLVIGTRFKVPRGETREIVTTFRMPRGVGGLVVAPSARARPVEWTVEGQRYDDATGFVARFGPFIDPTEDDDWLPISLMGVLVALAGLATMRSGTRRDLRDDRGVRLARIDSITGAALLTVGLALAVAAVFLAG